MVCNSMTTVKAGLIGTLVNDRLTAKMACPNNGSSLSMEAIGKT
jgi:hypothetical protein